MEAVLIIHKKKITLMANLRGVENEFQVNETIHESDEMEAVHESQFEAPKPQRQPKVTVKHHLDQPPCTDFATNLWVSSISSIPLSLFELQCSVLGGSWHIIFIS